MSRPREDTAKHPEPVRGTGWQTPSAMNPLGARQSRVPSLTDSQRMVLSESPVFAGMNSAHSWHTKLVRECGFAVERNEMFYFLEARFCRTSLCCESFSRRPPSALQTPVNAAAG